MNCDFCFDNILHGETVRTLSPVDGVLHPQTHVVPHGTDIDNNPVDNACNSSHGNMNHIHEKCLNAWCDKFNMPVPEPFEPGDWERIQRTIV